MKLGGHEIALAHSCAKRQDMSGGGNGEVTHRHIETVHKVSERTFIKPLEQTVFDVFQLVPAHVRHFLLVALRLETADIRGEDAQTIHIPLL